MFKIYSGEKLSSFLAYESLFNPMITNVLPCTNSEMFYAVENGFRFDFPSSIAEALTKYLERKVSAEHNSIIGEWVLSLPFYERMKVNIQLTADRK